MNMNSIIPEYSTAGLVFSIVSLTLVVPVLVMFRHYFRSLDFLQMAFFFAKVMYEDAFSLKLFVSVFNFDRNFYNFCQKDSLICTLGFQLSFGSVLLGLIVIIGLFIIIKKCCGTKNLQFQPVYFFFKGFFRFIYIPMVYYSTDVLVTNLESKTYQRQFISSVVILGFCGLFPIVQLIGYKCIQQQQAKISIWVKWLEFFSYYRLAITGALLGLYSVYQDVIYLHCVMIALILYPVIFIWKGQFTYPISQRIIAGLSQGAFLVVFYLFKYHPEAFQKYDLDFFLLGFVLVLDTFVYIIKAILIACYGKNDAKVNVQLNQSLQKLQSGKKGNKYDPVQGDSSKRKR